MKKRKIQRLSEFCVLGLAVALNVAPIRGQNAPATTPAPQTPQTQSQPGARGSSSTAASAATTGQMTPSMFLSRAIESNSAEIQLSRLAATKAQNDQVKSYAQMLVKDHTAVLEKLQKLQGSQTAAANSTTRQQSSTTTTTDKTDTAGARSTTPGTTGTPGAAGTPQTGQRGTQGTQSAQGPRGAAGTQGTTSASTATADRSLPAINEEHQRLLTRLNGLSGSQFDREFMDAMVSAHREAVRNFEQQAGTSSASGTPASSQANTGAGQGTTGPQGQPSTQKPGTTGNQTVGSAQRESPDNRAATSTSASTPSATEVAALARELLPTLRQHLERAEQIQKTLK